MKTFKVPGKTDVSPSNQAIFEQLEKMIGFVPNLYATLALSEHGLEKSLAFQNAKSSLSSDEKEAINLVVSEINGCTYCLSAHTTTGKMNGFSDEEVYGLRSGNSDNPKLHAFVRLVKDITENKGRASSANVDAFYAAGYLDGHLVDLILQISGKIAINYLHNLTQVPIDFPVAKPLAEAAVAL